MPKIKQPRTGQLNIRLSDEERGALEKLAEKESRTPADQVRVLIKRAASKIGIVFTLATIGCGGAPFSAIDSVIDAASDHVTDAPSEVSDPHDSGTFDAHPSEAAFDGAGDAVGDSAGDGCLLVTHSDGIGQTWTDCASLSTFDEVEAMAACEANANAQSSPPACVANACGGEAGPQAVCNLDLMVAGFCSCWTYTGSSAGHVMSHACDGDPSQAVCGGGDTWN